jgi:hypothetical protein
MQLEGIASCPFQQNVAFNSLNNFNVLYYPSNMSLVEIDMARKSYLNYRLEAVATHDLAVQYVALAFIL